MADDFNPYHVWLGIPPEDQPANYYRLLSLDLFETSGDVIDSAADRQMAHLRTFQSGKHGELIQRLLNEVAAARVCLLDPKKRAAYDQQLRAKLPLATPAAASAASGSAIQRQPPRRPGPLPTVAPVAPPTVPVAAALPQPASDWDDLLGDPAAKPSNRSVGKSASANAAKAERGQTGGEQSQYVDRHRCRGAGDRGRNRLVRAQWLFIGRNDRIRLAVRRKRGCDRHGRRRALARARSTGHGNITAPPARITSSPCARPTSSIRTSRSRRVRGRQSWRNGSPKPCSC